MQFTEYLIWHESSCWDRMSVQWPGSKGKPSTFPRETMTTENLQEQPELMWWAGKLKIHIELCELLVFQLKMDVQGAVPSAAREYRVFYHSWAGSSQWGGTGQFIADGFSFLCYYFSAKVFCKAAADQISVGMGLCPEPLCTFPTPLCSQLLCVSFWTQLTYQVFRLIENFSPNHQLQVRLSCSTTAL